MEKSKNYINERCNKIWYLPSRGKDYYHHINGPAVEFADGTKHWYINGELHRIDGPAVEWANGAKMWYIDGKQLPRKKVEDWLKENEINLKTIEGQIAFKLWWL